MNRFNNRLKSLRLNRNMSIQQVADYLDMSEGQMKAIETGKRNASKYQVLKLANYLKTDEKELIKYYLMDQISREKINRGHSQRLENLSIDLHHLDSSEMQVRIHEPGKPFGNWIKQIIFYKGKSKNHLHERVLPDGHINLVFNLADGINSRVQKNDSQPGLISGKAWVVGVQEKHSDCIITKSETSLTVQFTMTGFHVLTGIPVTEIKNSILDADIIFGTDIFLLREQLMFCHEYSTDRIAEVLKAYFQEKKKEIETEAAIVSYITENIHKPLDQLVQKTGYSHKHVIHLFKKHTGISPKYCQRIHRFNNTLKDIHAVNSNFNWLDIAFRNNYYDQSHFIKEFRYFTGFNPQSYLETGNTCSKLLRLKNTPVN